MSGEEEIKCWTGGEGEDKAAGERREGATSGKSWPDRHSKNAQVSVLSLAEHCSNLMSWNIEIIFSSARVSFFLKKYVQDMTHALWIT